MDTSQWVSARLTVPAQNLEFSLEPSRRVTFGRDPAMDLVFSGDPGLSRCAGDIHHRGHGVEVTNRSGKHSLFVQSPSGRVRLPPADNKPALSTSLVDGTFEITIPNWETSDCRIIIEISPGAHDVTPIDAPRGRTETHYPLRLNPATKEFATALVLCRPKLTAGAAAVAMPTVPELTRQVLAATDAWHLVRQFDEDPTARTRLTGRIHEHLKQLRAKLAARELGPPGALAPPVLADVLIENDIIVPSHLALLGDAKWLAIQAGLWWS
ncbi:FHA domain-containing protein [Pseudonocardia spinosispora]|uniref:FHA domain-containing protein n=1 Tax=Pseudonocardia spinosispora TaxID=103441 RepID=UPI00048D32BA|nr:FHA domain-containing protein [Pseudonocardia spinosispora]